MVSSSLFSLLFRNISLQVALTGLTSSARKRLFNKEGPEGVKWELGFAHLLAGKMGFHVLGLRFINKKTIDSFPLQSLCPRGRSERF